MNFTIKSVTPNEFKSRLESIRKNALEANIFNIFKKDKEKENNLNETNDKDASEENKETRFMSLLESMKNPLDEKLNGLIDSYKEKQDLSVLKEIHDHVTNKKELEKTQTQQNINEKNSSVEKKNEDKPKITIDPIAEEKKDEQSQKTFYVSNLGESLEAAKRNNVGVSAIENVISQHNATEKEKENMNVKVVKGMNKIIENIQTIRAKEESTNTKDATSEQKDKLSDFAVKPKLPSPPTPFDKKF